MLSHANQTNKQDLVEQVRLACQRKHCNFTLLRQQVFEIVLNANKPIGAYTIMDELALLTEKTKVAPPTVYRSLEFLCEVGAVQKIHSLNTFIARKEPNKNTSETLFICTRCGHAEAMANNSIQQAINLTANHQKFDIQQQVLEIVGTCQQCKKQRVTGEAYEH